MQSKRKTILITGGAGFIGSHLCEKYLADGWRVICLDNLQTTRTPKNVKHLFKDKNFKFIKHDIIKPINLGEKVDWIFNFACAGSYTSYQFDPVHTVKTNTAGVINMLELARKNKARIMQASTSEVYGDPLECPQAETYLGNVNMLGPRACYDEGKRCAETLFMDYSREYGVDIKIIRIFNTYGPKMDLNDGRAMTNFIVNALAGRDLVVYGDGTATRSFQYVDDLILAIDKMMSKENFIGPVNLGNPEEISILDLAKLIISKTGSQSKIIFEKKASDDPKRRCPDINLAKKELGWSPQITLEQGLAKTIEYFKSVERPDKKILIFATTYYPDLGPAEQALYDLSANMPDTEFHIITSRFRKNLLASEKLGKDTVYRLGVGAKIDKYFLPILGVIKAWRLNRKNKYKFVWSVMASYGGLAAMVLKLMDKNINFLLTMHKSEIENKSLFKRKIVLPLFKMLFREADSIYISDANLESQLGLAQSKISSSIMAADGKSFVNQVRYTYADLLNKQEKKLARPK